MRVALIVSLVSPIRAAEANGPHSVVLDLADGLARRGHAVEIYAAHGSIVGRHALVEIAVPPQVAAAQIQPNGAVAVGRRTATAALRAGFQQLFAELRSRRPDVIGQHAFDAPAIELAAGLPALHTLHLPPLDADVVRAARASRGTFVTVSNAAARGWSRAGVPSVGVIRNGAPDVEPVEHVRRDFALIPGRVSPEKGTHIAIRAARASGLAARVVGDIYDSAYYASEVEPLLTTGETVRPLPRAELGRLMSAAAAVLMPVRWEEPFGLVAAEAQMAGCPVVGFRRGALPEVVRDGVGGYLVIPDDEGALAEAIPRALRLDRSTIRASAQADLGVDRMVDDYERAFAAIIAGCDTSRASASRSSLPLAC